jgi:hypothetical protein
MNTQRLHRRSDYQAGSRKRPDITVVGKRSLIVIELKKLNGQRAGPPTQAVLTEYHDHLNGYVTFHSSNENKKAAPRVVAGFVVVMYAKGRRFVLRGVVGRRPDKLACP